MTRLEEIQNKLKRVWITSGYCDCLMASKDNIKIKTEHLRDMDKEFKYLISRIEKLEAALRFYADQEPTHKLPFSEGDTDPEKLNAPLIPLPPGVARAALSDSDEQA